MTLALYGKSKRRKGVLIALALFSVVFALVSGVASQRNEPARGQVANATLATPTGTCGSASNALTDDGSRATCANGQNVEAAITTPGPPHASDIGFRITVNGRSGSGINQQASVVLSSTSKPALAPQTISLGSSSTDSDFFIPDSNNCSNWGTTWVTADFAGLKIKIQATTSGGVNIDDIVVEECWGARTITSATVGGGTSTSVVAGAAIPLVVNVTTTNTTPNLAAESNDWFCTTYQIEGQSAVVQNHANTTASGNQSQSWNITAPAADGTYDLTLIAYSDDACTLRASNTFILPDAIVVKTTRQITVQKVAENTTHSGATFSFSVTYVGGPSSVNVTLGANAAISSASAPVTIPLNGSPTVVETNAAGWTSTDWKVISNNTGDQTCTDSNWNNDQTTATIPSDSNDYLVCFRNTPPAAQSAPTITTQAASGAVALNGSVTDSVTVSGSAGTPTGSVTFFVCGPSGGNPNCATGATQVGAAKPLTGGAATSDSYSPTQAGNYCFRAEYSGDTSYAGGSHTNQTTAAAGNLGECFTVAAPTPNVNIAKGNSTANNTVASGGTFNWVVTATVTNGPTTAAASIVDTLPAGFSTTGLPTFGGTGTPGLLSCDPIVGQVLTCALATGAADGTYSITIPIQAPVPASNTACTGHTNSATVAGGGGTTSGSPATNQVTVTCPNVSVVKTAGTSPVNVGTNVQFTVTVTNAGPGVASNVQVSDTLSDKADWDIVPAVTGCAISGTAYSNEVLACTFTTMNQGDAKTITLVGATRSTPNPNSCGPISNSVSITVGNEAPGNTGDNASGPVSVTVQCPSLSVAKSAVDSAIDVGNNVAFDVVVANSGPGSATGVSVDDPLPSPTGLVWNASAPMTFAPAGSSGSCAVAANTLTCSGIDLAAGQQVTVRVTGSTGSATTTAICGNVTNPKADATVSGITSSSSSATVFVRCPSLSTAKSANPTGPVNAGAAIGWDIVVSNASGATIAPASGVTVTDTLPTFAGVNWTGATTTDGGSCSISGSPQVLTCVNQSIPVGSSITIHVNGTTTATGDNKTCGSITNQFARAAGLGVDSDSSSASVTVNCPDPSVAKSGNGPISAGDNLVFTMTVTAGGTGTPSVHLTDTMPGPGLSWSMGGANSGNCSPAGPINSGSQYTCDFNNLSPGDIRVVTFTAASTTAQCAAAVSNTANISSTGDVNTNNNSATASITVNCPNVTLSKQADASPVNAGENIGFTISAGNTGTGTAHGFSITDNLPGNGTNWSIDSNTPPNTCSLTGPVPNQVLNCSPAGGTQDLGPGASITVHVTSATTAASCTQVHNVASATATNQANAIGDATSDITVNCPDVNISKTADNGTVSAGDVVEFTITVNNSGAGQANGVIVTDNPLPAGVTWSLAPPSPAECSITGAQPGQHLDCTFATLDPSSPVVIKIQGLSSKENCGTLSNTATVSATNEPGNLGQDNSSTATIAVNCADIGILKTPDGTPKNATDSIGFTITATNNGQGAAQTVTVTDTLPTNAGLNWVIDGAGSDAGCSISTGTLTCNWGTLAFNASKHVHITSATTVATCGQVENTAGVTTLNGGSANSPATIVVNCPNVTVLKALPLGQANPVNAGDQISFKITVSVNGTGTAYNVMLNDTLPPSTSGWSISNPVNGCGVALNFLTCAFGNLAAGTTIDVVVSGFARSATGEITCATISNEANVSAGNESNTNDNSSTATIGVNCPDISIAKTASNSPISAGDLAKFKLTVTNGGQGIAKNVVVGDVLPAGPTWSLNPAINGCVITQGVLACAGGDVPNLSPGQTFDIFIEGTTTTSQCGSLVNVATASASNDPDGQQQSAPATTVVSCPNVSVLKSADNSPISAGDTASYTITVSNSGPGTAHDVTLDDAPLAGIAWSAGLGGATFCSLGAELHCTFGDLAPGATQIVQLSGTTAAAQCGLLTNTATVAASNERASDSGNNISTAGITVNCPDIVVEKTPDAGSISAGETATFTIKVSNTGAGTAHNVLLSDALPAGLTWTTTDTDCAPIVAGQLDCSWASIAAADSETVTVSAPTSAAVCQQLLNTASASAANEAEDATANNTDSGLITVLCPDVDVLKSADNGTINPGETAAFTISVHNDEPGAAFNVGLTDNLPVGVAWSEDSDLCTIANGILACGWTTIAASSTQTVHLTGATTTAQCGTIQNTATITLDNEPQTGVGDNSSSASIVVACGSIQIVKIDQVSPNGPQRPADGDWDFTITGPNQFNQARAIALGGGSVTIINVPLGSGYSAVEAEAQPGACPVPNATGAYRSTGPGGPQDLASAGDVITFTFTNFECGIVLSTGLLVINKVADLDGDHVQDPGEPGLAGWPITVKGPEFPAGQVFLTDANGRVILPGVSTGVYTVSEGSRAGYQVVGVVADDNGPVFNASTSASVDLTFDDTDTVTFFNQPLGEIDVHKVTVTSHNGGPDQPASDDDDGWVIGLTSSQCSVVRQAVTDTNGNAQFTNLPLCGDYVVGENTVNPTSPGYQPAGVTTVSHVSAGQLTPTLITFTNRRVTSDSTCTTCDTQATPTSTPTLTPTGTTPPANTPPNTNTPAFTPATSTPSPVSHQAGERTPGPGSPTPVAPNTGEGWMGGAVGGANFLLLLLGLAAAASGLAGIGASRRPRRR